MLVFAHRGASSVAPENTLAAFQIAIDDKVDGIELDVQLVDGVAIVLHDRWLQKTTTGLGRLDQVSFEYCQTLDAGDGEKIPTLEQALQLIAGQCKVNIEIKALQAEHIIVSVAQKAVAEYGFKPEQIIISSFNAPALHTINQIAPEFPIGALTANIPLDYATFAEQLNAKTIHCDVGFINAEFVQDAHKRGLKVLVYTVNHIDDIESMRQIGVDGIFTDYPNRAIHYLANLSSD